MRRIINGSVYDTETAQPLYEWEDEDTRECRTLYRSKSGQFFEYYLDLDRNEPGYVLQPLTRRGALLWAFRMIGNVEKAKEVVGYDNPEEGKKQISVRISKRTYRILRETAAERNKSMGALIEEMVEGTEGFVEPDLDNAEEMYLLSLSEEELLEELKKEEKRQAEIKKMVKELQNGMVKDQA